MVTDDKAPLKGPLCTGPRGSPGILNQQMLVLASAGFRVPVVTGHPLSLVQVVVVVVVVVIMTVAKVY